ncbi:MAG: beta-glucosidase, partial [Caulobacter sp. 39-67-4]
MVSKASEGGRFGPSRRSMLAGAVALAGFSVTAPARAASRASDRIEALLARMTIEEKAGQLSCFADMIRPPIGDINPQVNIRNAQTLLAESGSFDPHLCERTARAAASEASASGLHWTFAPMVDVARDQRWGRVAEGAGEDVYLGQVLAEARVRGFQGKDLKAEDSMLATPKHFAAYGAVTAGLDYNAVELSEATLREVHLPPFQAAFAAGALTTMSAFNDINGVPSTGNKRLMTDILRGEWGFKGVVISD